MLGICEVAGIPDIYELHAFYPPTSMDILHGLILKSTIRYIHQNQ